MERKELITQVKQSGIQTQRPPHMIKSIELKELLKSKPSSKSSKTMKDRIIELHNQEMSYKQIKNTLEQENWQDTVRCGKVRMVYIYTVIRNYKNA